MHFIAEQFHNQFLSGGLMLLLTGAIMALLRKIPERVFEWSKRRITVEVEILNSDALFDYVTFWLDKHPYSRRSRKLTAALARDEGSQDGPSDGRRERKVHVLFSPAPGSHVFFYEGKVIWLERRREGPPSGENHGGISLLKKAESYHFTVLGRDQSGVRKMIGEIVQVATEPTESIRVFHSGFGYWQSFGVVKPRKLNSVILPDGQVEMVLADAQKFIGDAEWYRSVGIPWHRGYLLWGKPGTGKTSLVSALAGELGMDLYLLNVAGSGMDDERLNSLMSDTRPGTIVLMEDVDCTFPDREHTGTKRVTLSGLLNCLDGVQSRDGSMIFMTTNMIERLDPALIRPGRVDVRLEFDVATASQIQRLRDRIAPGYEFGVREMEGFTMAEVQQYLLDRRSTARYREQIA